MTMVAILSGYKADHTRNHHQLSQPDALRPFGRGAYARQRRRRADRRQAGRARGGVSGAVRLRGRRRRGSGGGAGRG